ncbi:hypothetical protein [Oceanobacter mangrovi]|uniref:hypothetical protein n=1 Tax=Oceanobacter mangrovi TaxID=2862510 RepID=UPI001C8EADAA|nr:hypothetical protein [Oceanobacter mangrovi]
MAMVEIEEIEHRWIESNRLISLLVLLEYEYPEIMERIQPTQISTESVAEMLSFALDFGSRHWAEKAVTWIESGFPIDISICDKLLKISASKIDSQNLRHRSLKQAKRWQRAIAI